MVSRERRLHVSQSRLHFHDEERLLARVPRHQIHRAALAPLVECEFDEDLPVTGAQVSGHTVDDGSMLPVYQAVGITSVPPSVEVERHVKRPGDHVHCLE